MQKPIPRINVIVTRELRDKLKEKAKKKGMNMSEAVMAALAKWV